MGQLSKDFDFVVNGTPHILMIDPVINKVEGIIEGKALATAERNTSRFKQGIGLYTKSLGGL